VRCFVKKGLLILAAVLAGASTLSAAQPNWLLNLDGEYGINTAPATLSGDSLGGGKAGIEWLPTTDEGQMWGLDLDYNFLAVGKSPNDGSDNDIDLSLRYFAYTAGITSITVQGGVGYNATPNSSSDKTPDGHYLAFIEPGVRVVVAPRVAIDGGIQYLLTTPAKNMDQSLGITLGLSIPLDADFKAGK